MVRRDGTCVLIGEDGGSDDRSARIPKGDVGLEEVDIRGSRECVCGVSPRRRDWSLRETKKATMITNY